MEQYQQDSVMRRIAEQLKADWRANQHVSDGDAFLLANMITNKLDWEASAKAKHESEFLHTVS